MSSKEGAIEGPRVQVGDWIASRDTTTRTRPKSGWRRLIPARWRPTVTVIEPQFWCRNRVEVFREGERIVRFHYQIETTYTRPVDWEETR